MQSVSVNLDIAIDILNQNKELPIAYDPVNVTFSFPATPDEIVGRGVLQSGEIEPQGKITRPLHAVFDAPWSVLGKFM